MTDPSVKDKISRAIDGLPADASFEDAMERLYLLYKIERGRRELDAGLGIAHEDVKQRIKNPQHPEPHRQ